MTGTYLVMTGPPGSGKTLLARAMPSILPPMTVAESLEVTRIYSVRGLLPPETPLLRDRPFRAPHHTTSHVGLVGGGSWPRPGEISLAQRGVLFLDELPEFSAQTLEVLRQPLEDRQVTLARASGTLTFPANFTLVAAMNPCPCMLACRLGSQRTSNPWWYLVDYLASAHWLNDSPGGRGPAPCTSLPPARTRIAHQTESMFQQAEAVPAQCLGSCMAWWNRACSARIRLEERSHPTFVCPQYSALLFLTDKQAAVELRETFVPMVGDKHRFTERHPSRGGVHVAHHAGLEAPFCSRKEDPREVAGARRIGRAVVPQGVASRVVVGVSQSGPEHLFAADVIDILRLRAWSHRRKLLILDLDESPSRFFLSSTRGADHGRAHQPCAIP